MSTMRTSAPLAADCALLETEPLRMLVRAAHLAIGNRRIVCVSGDPGCGKTVALDVLANDLTERGVGRVVHVELLHSTTDKQVISSLTTAVTGERVNSRLSVGDLSNMLRYRLASESVVLIIDEAQHASNRVLEIVRQIHEHPTSRSGLVLAGAGLMAKLKTQPTLDSRVSLRVQFRPITEVDLVQTVQSLHPLLRRLSPQEIHEIDDELARGHLRHWAKILEWLIALTVGDAAPTPETIAFALQLVSGSNQ